MRLLRRPGPWAAAFFLWAATLWWLSSRVHEFPPGLEFKASDKVLHFGYFFGGAGLFSAALFLWKPELAHRRRILISVAVLTLVGVLDEFHQSFVPGRQGNDLPDIIADFLGALAGSLVFHRLRHLLAGTPEPQQSN